MLETIIFAVLMGVLFLISLMLWLRHRHTLVFEAITVVSLLAAIVFLIEALLPRWYIPEVSTLVLASVFLVSAIVYNSRSKPGVKSHLLKMVAKSSPHGAAFVSKVLYPSIKDMEKKKAQLEHDIETVQMIRDKMRDRVARLKIEEEHFKLHQKDFMKEKVELLSQKEKCYNDMKELEEIRDRLKEEEVWAREKAAYAERELGKIVNYEEKLKEASDLSKVLEEERSDLHKKLDDVKRLERKLVRERKRLGRKTKKGVPKKKAAKKPGRRKR